MRNIVLLIAASGLFCIGHLLRNIRWRLVLGAEARFTTLLTSLSFSYALNTVLPFRIGEVFRVIIPFRKNRIDLPRLILSLIYEKFTDLFFVNSFLLVAYFQTQRKMDIQFDSNFKLLTLILCSVTLTAFFSRSFFQIIFNITKFLNPRTNIIFLLIRTCLMLTENYRVKIKAILMLTMMMWVFYLSAIGIIAQTAGKNFFQTLNGFWGSITQSTYLSLTNSTNERQALTIVLLIAFPLLVFSIVSQFSTSRIYKSLKNLERKFSLTHQTPVIYLSKKTFENYLNDLFMGKQNQLQSIIPFLDSKDRIIEDISGGSGAATFKGIRSNKSFALKVANNQEDAQRLIIQHAALEKLAKIGIPTPRIIKVFGNQQQVFGYATEYLETSQTLSDALINGNKKALVSLDDLLKRLSETIHSKHKDVRRTDLSVIYSDKIDEIFSRIEPQLRSLSLNEDILVNGKLTKLVTKERFTSALNTFPAIQNECVAIHGDLTFENIVFTPINCNYFLMDPNPSQPLVHPSVDFGKILQSIELAYETVDSKSVAFSWASREIQYSITKPVLYREAEKVLLNHVENLKDFGSSQEIFALSNAQLILHILRLLPYKIKNEPTTFPYYVSELSLKINKLLADAE
jgi:thiamine kinase-like enzyme